MGAHEFLSQWRERWAIEHQFHWVRHVPLHEDAGRVRTGAQGHSRQQAAAPMAAADEVRKATARPASASRGAYPRPAGGG